MQVIPAINCIDLACVRAKVEKAKSFLPSDGWLHLDVADAHFTFNRTWGDPGEWHALGVPFAFEVHLMAEQPERVAETWLRAGAKRLIVHVEAMRGADTAEILLEMCGRYGAELMLAENPETPVERVLEYQTVFSSFQLLGVQPGLAGQTFYPIVLEKIRALRSALPSVKIEIDGGVNREIGYLAKEAGADIAVSASYIFENPDPALAYRTLSGIE